MEGIRFLGNTIQTADPANADLELRASGTGKVKFRKKMHN